MKFEIEGLNHVADQVKNAAKQQASQQSYEITCPHCQKTYRIFPGKVICPFCRKEFEIELDFDF